MARDRVLPSALATVAPGGSPRLALVATTAAAVVLASSGTYEQLIAFAVAVGILGNLAVDLAALRLRRSEPNLARPWRAALYPWSFIVPAAINIALLGGLIYEDPLHSLAGTGLSIAIGVLYWLKTRLRPTAIQPA